MAAQKFWVEAVMVGSGEENARSSHDNRSLAPLQQTNQGQENRTFENTETENWRSENFRSAVTEVWKSDAVDVH